MDQNSIDAIATVIVNTAIERAGMAVASMPEFWDHIADPTKRDVPFMDIGKLACAG